MATKMVIVDDRPVEKRRNDWLYGLDDKVIACRGDHHSWPILVPRRKWPKNAWRSPAFHDGSFQITESCQNCGRERTTTTGPGGVWGATQWTYRNPKGYAAPRGLGLTKTDYKVELNRRLTEDLVDAPVRVTERDREPEEGWHVDEAAQEGWHVTIQEQDASESGS